MSLKKMLNVSLTLLSLIVFTSGTKVKSTDDEALIKSQIVKYTIKPSKTDPSIKNSDISHFVMYDRSIQQNKLLLFLPGSNGIPERGPMNLFMVAVKQGYRVISLSYINRQSVSKICRGDALDSDKDCAEHFREKRIYGTNSTALISDLPQDAIVHRLKKLLVYLSEFDADLNWESFINSDGTPKWENIVVSGQSQGGGMACFIAKRHLVSKVISFSGGWDRAPDFKIADWYHQKSITPQERWFGIYNTKEPMAKTIKKAYDAMAISEHQIYPLSLPVREGRKAHGEGIRNTAYKDLWIELLGSGLIQ